MSDLSIGQIAKKVGISASAIRYYESEGLLDAPLRFGGKRRYGEEVLTQIAYIQLAKASGFSIREIKKILSEKATVRYWLPFATQKLKELDEKIESLRGMKKVLANIIKCRCENGNECSLVTKR